MSPNALTQWLRSLHLFSSFSEEDARALLQACERLEVPAGATILETGAMDTHLYLVYQGEVLLWVDVEEGETLRPMSLGRCRRGDYFNVEAAVWGIRATCNARALRPTVLFRISHAALWEWRSRYPDLNRLLHLVDQARERGRVRRPYWLLPEELLTIYVRPHIMSWATRQWMSVLLVLVALALLLWWTVTPQFQSLLAAALLALLGAVGWCGYTFLEWRNDASAITPLRAVQIERIVLVYEAREEIPLHMMVAKEVATSWYDRLWHMGDVIVRTQGPSLVLRRVPYPELLERVLEEYRRRYQGARLREEYERMAAALRERLNLPKKEEEPQIPPPPEEQPPPLPWWQALWRQWLAPRVEEGAVVTYYRHWFFLLWPLLGPFLAFLILTSLSCAHLAGLMHMFSLRTLGVLSLLALVLVLIYSAWTYYEWRNDYYQVTPSHLVDVKRVVLGPEQRHTAPLEEVRSIDYEQPSLLARLLNFGNVFIYTGGDRPLVFYEVATPAQVQYDIFQRLSSWQQRKMMEQWKQERERFLEWLAVYNDLAKEVFQPPPSSSPPPSPSSQGTQEGTSSGPDSGETSEEEFWVPPPIPL